MTFNTSQIFDPVTDERSLHLRNWKIDRAKERGIEKRSVVLNWIYRWGYASASTIVGASGAADRGYPQRLVKLGLIRAVPTTRCSTVKKIFVLTMDGLDVARSDSASFLEYPEVDSRRINQATVTHNLVAQQEILCRLPNFSAWKSDREFGQNIADSKRPDGALVDLAGNLWGIEIELSGKWARRLDQMAARIVIGIANKHFSGFHVLCGTAAMAQRYRAAFALGAKIPLWKSGPVGSGKFFSREHLEPLPGEISEAISIEVLRGLKR